MKRVFLSRKSQLEKGLGFGPFVIFGRVRELEHVPTWSPDKILSCYSQISGVCGGGGLTSQAQRAFVGKPKDALRDIES